MIPTLLIAAVLATGSPSIPDPEKDCPTGLVCFLPEEVGEMNVRVIELERDLKLAKAKGKSFGWTIGCGGGVTLSIDDSELAFEAAPVCAAIWGLRW